MTYLCKMVSKREVEEKVTNNRNAFYEIKMVAIR